MKRWPLVAGAAALALGVASFPLGCGGKPRPDPARLETRPGLSNLGLVAEGLYRGAQPTDEGLDSLKAMDIRTVINLRHFHGHHEEKACRERGLDYVWITLESGDAPSDEDVRRFLQIATDPKRHPLFFHCMHGQDRTGTMCACYRMAVQDWPLPEALAEMDDFGFNRLWRDLRAYVESFPARARSVRPARP